MQYYKIVPLHLCGASSMSVVHVSVLMNRCLHWSIRDRQNGYTVKSMVTFLLMSSQYHLPTWDQVWTWLQAKTLWHLNNQGQSSFPLLGWGGGICRGITACSQCCHVINQYLHPFKEKKKKINITQTIKIHKHNVCVKFTMELKQTMRMQLGNAMEQFYKFLKSRHGCYYQKYLRLIFLPHTSPKATSTPLMTDSKLCISMFANFVHRKFKKK